jgi:hypothetical protein
MTKTLTKNVHVHTDTGTRSFSAGDELPAELEDLVTNEDVFTETDEELGAVPGPSQSVTPEEAAAQASGETGDGPLDERSVKQLRALAAQHNVDLEGARTKADIVDALGNAGVDDGSNDG